MKARKEKPEKKEPSQTSSPAKLLAGSEMMTIRLGIG